MRHKTLFDSPGIGEVTVYVNTINEGLLNYVENILSSELKSFINQHKTNQNSFTNHINVRTNTIYCLFVLSLIIFLVEI